MNKRQWTIGSMGAAVALSGLWVAVRTAASEPSETVTSGVIVVDGKEGDKAWVTVRLTVRAEALSHDSASEFAGWGTFFIDGMATDGRVDVQGYPEKDCEFSATWSDDGQKRDASDRGRSQTVEITKELASGARVPFTIKSSIASACGCSVSQGHLTIDIDVTGGTIE